MKPTRNEIKYAVGLFRSQHVASRLTIPAVSTNQIWKRVCVFLCQKTGVEGCDRSRSFPFLFFQQFNSMLCTDTSTSDTSSTPTNSSRQHVGPESSCSCFSLLVGFFAFILSLEFLLPRVAHLRFSSRHLHEILSIGPMSSPFGPTSRFSVSLDLRAHCSANDQHRSHMLVSVDFTSLFEWKLKMLFSYWTGMSSFFPCQFTNFSK